VNLNSRKREEIFAKHIKMLHHQLPSLINVSNGTKQQEGTALKESTVYQKN
jgi:hypothetical protein